MFYLTKQESILIKGILTILIVIGHNHILVPHQSDLMLYLYTFHVICFFILPWMYNNKKELTFNNIGNLIYRNWIPYIIFFIFSLLVFSFLEGKLPNIRGSILAFVTGNQKLLKENVGFIFLWFLPTFCSFSILKLISDNNKLIMNILILVSIVIFLLPPYLTQYVSNIYLPFGVFYAIKYFLYGFIVAKLLKWRVWTKYIGAIVFIISSYLYWTDNINRFIILFMPICAFMFILSIIPILKMKWLSKVGNYSLPIYTTHVYIYNVFELLLPNSEPIFGFINLFITLILAYIISNYIYKIECIRKIIFPTYCYNSNRSTTRIS